MTAFLLWPLAVWQLAGRALHHLTRTLTLTLTKEKPQWQTSKPSST